MDTLRAIILGLVQGITEFLPISSSAHLILMPYLFGWSDQGLGFDIIANAGTLIAVLVYFRRDWRRMLRHLISRPRLADDGAPAADHGDVRSPRQPSLLWLLALGTLPVVVAGLTFHDWIAGDARSATVIATASIIFGLLLWWSDHKARQERNLLTLGWRDALWIGLAQALALVPGTSRSGITITAGLMLGLKREDAAKFSFLLAVPVSCAALLLDVRDLWQHGPPAGGWWPLLVGFVTAAVSAYLVIGWLLAFVRRRSLAFFVVYRVVLGVLLLLIPLAV